MSGSRAISSEDSIENNKGKRMVNSDDEDEAKYPPDHLLPIKKRRYSPTSHPHHHHQSTSEPNPSNSTEVKNEEITEDEGASSSVSTPDEEEPNNYAEVNLEENDVPRKNRSAIPKRGRNMDYGMKVLVDKVLTSSYKTYSPFHLPRKPAEELFPNLQTKREQMVEFRDLIAQRKREMKVVYYEGFGTGYQVQRGWNEFMTEHRLEMGDRVRLYKREMYWDVLPTYFIDYVKGFNDSGVSPSQSSSAGGRNERKRKERTMIPTRGRPG